MRIVILQNPDETISEYDGYISGLIVDYAKWLGYEILYPESINELKNKTANCIFILENKGSWLPHFLFENKIVVQFKKTAIDVCINLTGKNYNKISPQLLTLDEAIFNNNKKKFLAALNAKRDQNFATIITYADFEKEKINGFFFGKNISAGVIPFSAPIDFKAFEWPDKVLIKSQYAANKEYFLCLGDESETLLLEVLKGFSKFKKWQQSSMQLIIIMDETDWLESFLKKLTTYRYKDDVQIIREINPSQLAGIFASAYAFLHITNIAEKIEPFVAALQCSIPVICPNTPVLHEYAGDAALYMTEMEMTEISKNMIGIYKNEIHKSQMEKSAKLVAQKLKRDDWSKKLWLQIESLAIKA